MSASSAQPCVGCDSQTFHFCELPGNLDETGTLQATESVTYFQCVECGTIQQNPMPSELELSQRVIHEYAHSDRRLSVEKKVSDSAELQHRAVVDVLLREGIRDRVLEVGTGIGNLCSCMIRSGIRCAGVELSPELVAVARQRGLPVEHKNLKSIAGSETYAAIVMSHVFEHLSDPAETLDNIHRLLTPGGCFVTVQPTAAMTNLISRALRLNRLDTDSRWGISYLNLNPWHIVIYSIRGMAMIGAKHGFDLLEVMPMPSLRSKGMIGVVRRGYQLFNTTGERIFPRRWPFHVAHLFRFRKK